MTEQARKKHLEYARKYREKNREKCNAATAKSRAKNPDYGVDYHLRRAYGITVEQYRSIESAQKGLCAICLQPPPKHWRYQKLVVDHNHKTGEVRGLLCNHCNTALGSLDENVERCYAVADYIKKWRVS